jgi:antitoxin (DNA-binding transcriptional repressor) of toxin-antitoxin stability system
MKAIKVTELKANLSKYLRLASRGTQILIKDRDEPLAQIGPVQGAARSWRERLEAQGRLRLGSQDWGSLRLSKPRRRVDIQASLRAVREEPSEVRRR